MKDAFLRAVAVAEGPVGTQSAAGSPKADMRGWVKKYQKIRISRTIQIKVIGQEVANNRLG